jgi:hypothetical protein
MTKISCGRPPDCRFVATVCPDIFLMFRSRLHTTGDSHWAHESPNGGRHPGDFNMNAARLFSLSVAALTIFGAASQVAQAQGKSRAEVKQELVQAQHTGVIPSSKTQYPPDANTIARNKQTHAIAWHGGEKAPSLDQHDKLAAK